MTGVSFVVPVHDGARTLGECLAAILAQGDGRPFELIVVDDASGDGSPAILAELGRREPRLRAIAGGGRGLSHALNLAIAAARYPLLAQVDQDVVLAPGWLAAILPALERPEVAAAQGWYATDARAGRLARAAGRDVEGRWLAAGGPEVDHVCTGITLYRREALVGVGGFDESLGYGSDCDLSYRLRAAGYRLRRCREARGRHAWRESLHGYLRQQYGQGYGRLDVIAKHPGRIRGDGFAGPRLLLRPPLLLLALGLLPFAPGASAALLAGLLGERAVTGIATALRCGDAAPLLFPALHLLRDAAWVGAVLAWSARRALAVAPAARHSM